MPMDRTRWELRGPVRTMRAEVGSAWQAERGEWGERRWIHTVTFDRAGRVAQVDQWGVDKVARTTYSYDDRGELAACEFGDASGGPRSRTELLYDDGGRHVETRSLAADGATHIGSRSSYDEHGRRTQVTSFGLAAPNVDSYQVEGSERGYPAPGAVRMTTRYDAQGHPADVIFHDAGGATVQHVRTTRDEHGRVLVEEATLPLPIPAHISAMADDERAALEMLLAATAGTVRTAWMYDTDGRCIERSEQWGRLREGQVTYRYNEAGFVAGQSTRATTRECGIDESGAPRFSADVTHEAESRYEYAYDARGNWVVRVISSRVEPTADFTPSAAEWRTIAYWD